MKKILISLFLTLLAFSFLGCGETKYPVYKEDDKIDLLFEAIVNEDEKSMKELKVILSQLTAGKNQGDKIATQEYFDWQEKIRVVEFIKAEEENKKQ
ncbi:hypothetical protein [Fusobacterium necrophorum]|uniref:Lipoprotein n=1 Tax=Fusobacterium necrophorum TaxID=859 RepID=A0A4Q2KSD9_9FUSO|nr:hypothetical protein [Fusobacterium necrophorum]RXZ68348.1 hypothetical protein EPT53_10010 [Fusobacterium necrophorum]